MAIVLNTKSYGFSGFNQAGFSAYRNTDASFPSGFSYLTSKVNTGLGGKPSNGKWNLSLPHIATASTACSCEGSVLGTDYVRVDYEFSPATSAADRLDAWTRLRDLVASNEFKASMTGLIQPSA